MFSWFNSTAASTTSTTSAAAKQKGDNFVVSVGSKNIFSFRKANQLDKPAKFVKHIENWMHNNYFAKALHKDKVIYNASNLIVGPTNAGKTVFISWLINNLLHVHPDKNFFIVIYSRTNEAVAKLRDVMTVLQQPNLINFERQVMCTSDLHALTEMFMTLEEYYSSIGDLIEKNIDRDEKEAAASAAPATYNNNNDDSGPFVTSLSKNSAAAAASKTTQQQLCKNFLEQLRYEFKISGGDEERRHQIQSKIKLIEKLSVFTDYIFYFDDCNDLFSKPPPIAAKLFSKIQTTNRHFFLTPIYSLQNVKKVPLTEFSSNLANMFVVGRLTENFKSLIEKYNVLKMVFTNDSNITAFYSSFDQIFNLPQYTIQWFSKNTPETIYWGIIPKQYVDSLDEKDERRRALKRKVNATVGTLFKDNNTQKQQKQQKQQQQPQQQQQQQKF